MTASDGSGTVSAIVVAYAHERYVVECLESIRLQSAPPAQVLIADDASPDRTPQVIRTYLAEHPGFATFYPNHRNIGLNATLNRLLAKVETDLVTYISADDVMLPDRLARQVSQLMEAPQAAFAYSDAIVIDEHSRELAGTSRAEFPWPAELADRTRPFAALLHANWMPAASLLLRTEVLRAVGGYHPEIFYEDFELLVRISRDHEAVWTEDQLVAVRRLADSLGSTGFRHDNPRFLHSLDVALRHYEGAEDSLRHTARAKRWELAKRSIPTLMPRRRSLRMLWGARRGASSPLALARHLGRWALSLARPRSWRAGG